jgi:predicted nucleic acid-binding protein
VALGEMLMADRSDLVLFDVTPDVINRAVNLARQFSLRGADAVHLATALIVREKLVDGETLSFVCSDTELLDAASRNSLEILNPAVA